MMFDTRNKYHVSFSWNSLSNLFLLFIDRCLSFILICSKVALGRACGVSRPVISCSITTNEASQLKSTIEGMKIKIEQLLL